MDDDRTAEHHTVGDVLYLCHTDDHYCPPVEHETHHLSPDASLDASELWMAEHGVDWGPVRLEDPLWRFGIYGRSGKLAGNRHFTGPGKLALLASLEGRLTFPASLPLLLIVETGDTLCWDGTHVQLHASNRQGVETCTGKEARMLKKHGTGTIITDDTEAGRIARTAVALTEAQRAGIIGEDPEEDPEWD